MNADLSEIRDALAKATPGEWVGATVGEYLVKTCADPDAHATYLHAVWATDETERQGRVIIVAYTGDGPTSYRNRELIANAPAWLAELCDEVERLRTKLDLPCGSCHPCINYGPSNQRNDSLMKALEQTEAWGRELADRAERAEAAVERVRAKAEGWAALFDNALTTEGQTLRDAARDILRALDGER